MNTDLFNAYLPLDRRHALAAGRDLPNHAEGSVLLADVAGFTPLADALASALGPERGAEELTRLLNVVYDALVAQVHGHRGSVVSFAGDGLVCWFEGDAGLRAVACGLAMQGAMISFTDLTPTSGGTVSISMKAGVAAGPVRRFLVGRPHIDLLAGTTLDRVARAEQVAQQGEVVVTPETVQLLGDRLKLGEERNGFAVVTRLTEEVPLSPWPDLGPSALTPEQVRPYLLPPVYERLAAGQGEFLAELRPAAALFLRFEGLDYERDDAGPQLDALVRWVQDVLARYEGHLLQLTAGDKGSFLYAAFGVPAAHEDDAQRAVAAAMALRQPPSEMAFITGVQIGLSRGRMRAGAYGGRTRRTYGAIGPQAIVACRLMEVAPAGEVWSSPAIYEATSERWTFEPLKPVMLKGKTEPVPIYRPLRRIGERATRATGTLIGRQAELETLAQLLAEAQSGRRRVLLLEGEAGIGKSRLLAELRQRAQRRGFAWLEGAGQSIEQGTPYRAWRDVLATYFGLDKHMDQAERQGRVQEHVTSVNPTFAQRVPLLNHVLRLDLPETKLTQSFDPQLRHESLTALIVDLLRATAAEGPLALVLEDGHWMDSLSWELALSVARALYDQPLLLVLALRPLEKPVPAESVLSKAEGYTALVGLEDAEALRLDALPPEETVALASARLGVEPEVLPPEVVELVKERAEGNPFFAEELAHVLHDSGTVVTRDGDCTLTGDLAMLHRSVPDTIEGVVLARIDRLPPEQQLTLKVAAAIGHSFLYRTLRDVHPQQVVTDLLRAQLDDLNRRELALVETLEPEPSYLFKHVITQQVAYDTLLFAQRRELHRAVAGWYERTYDDLSAYYPLLVHHYHQAEDAEQERCYARLAGERAATQYANVEAVRYLSRALDLTLEQDLEQRYTLLLARERVYHRQGAREAQYQDLESLQELADDALHDDRRRGEVALRRAQYLTSTSKYPAAIAAAQEAIRLGQITRDVHLEAEGHQEWGNVLRFKGDVKAFRSHMEIALALARRALLSQVEARSLWGLGVSHGMQGDYVKARAYFDQVLHIYREIGDLVGESRAISNLGSVSFYKGDYAKAKTYYEQAVRLCRDIGHRESESTALNHLGNIYSDQWDYVEARAYYEQSLRIRREINNQWAESNTLANLGVIFGRLGNYIKARTYFERALHTCRELGDQRFEGMLLCDLALLFHRRGDDQTAREYAQRALHIAQNLGDRNTQGHVLTNLGHAQMGLGNLAEATTAYRQALNLRRELGEHHRAIESLAGLANAYMAQSNLPQAHPHVEEILAYLENNNTLDGTESPSQVYLTCYRVLRANQDTRAQEILTAAYNLLQERAAKIEDEKLRRSFLENVAANREIVAAYRAMQDTDENRGQD